MPWVITKLCLDCKDTECAEVCPVDCIYDLQVEDENFSRNMLYIHPAECIDCAACEPACPWQAIYEDSQVPALFNADIELNAKVFEVHPPEDFTTDCTPIKKNPTPDEIAANKAKWGFA
ncbi:MAG: ferredoxin family protein [Ignavibacteria bacterium]|nr:ferredoxin family protein [Ignavibacteria bacterium]